MNFLYVAFLVSVLSRVFLSDFIKLAESFLLEHVSNRYHYALLNIYRYFLSLLLFFCHRSAGKDVKESSKINSIISLLVINFVINQSKINKSAAK